MIAGAREKVSGLPVTLSFYVFETIPYLLELQRLQYVRYYRFCKKFMTIQILNPKLELALIISLPLQNLPTSSPMNSDLFLPPN